MRVWAAPQSASTWRCLFAALSDPTRLRLLNLMDGREVCVCYFVEILSQSQPKISRHLAYLRRAGIVRRGAKESGCTTKSSCRPTRRGEDPRETLAVLRDEKAMQADLVRFSKACCTPQKLSALDGLPACSCRS